MMRVIEPMQYLVLRGVDPKARITCCMPGCSNKFIVANGVAFPGRSQGSDQTEMFFFCSEVCYLSGIDTGRCGSA